MTHAAGQAGLNGIIVYIFYRFVLFVYWHNHPVLFNVADHVYFMTMPLVMCSITNCAHVVAEIPFNKSVVQSDDKLSRNQYFSDYNDIVKVHCTFSVQHLTDQCVVIDRKTMSEQHLLKSVSLKSNVLIIAQLKFELCMLLYVN